MPDDLCGPDTVPDARARAEAMLNVQDRDAVTAFTDALTDLRHLADEYGIDFDAALSSSATHYEAEREVPRMYTMHNDSGETELSSADEAAGHLLAEIQDDYMNGRFSAFYGPDDEPVRFEITVRAVPRPENQA